MCVKPEHFKSRCMHTKVHFVLAELQRQNLFWSQPVTLSSLLGKGSWFISKAGPLWGLRQTKLRSFELYFKCKEYECKDAICTMEQDIVAAATSAKMTLTAWH